MNVLLLIIYLLINVFTFMLFVADKHKARKGAWRISEKTLIIASLFGPWGGTLGMKAAHHKTRKPKFKLVYIFLILHIILIAYFFVLH